MNPTGSPPPLPPEAADSDQRVRINDLPDHILESIISFLPAKNLLATTILSRKWRNLHTRAIRLDFDAPTPARIISSVLARHASALESFRLFHGPLTPSKELRLRRIIRRLNSLDLRRLSLSCTYSRVSYPAETFSHIATLQELDLSRCSLTDNVPGSGSSALSGCRTLRSLRLHKISINDTALVSIIAGLPLLELLGLKECVGLESLQIASRGLKRLEMEDINLVDAIRIDAPALTLLTISNVKDCDVSTILYAPSLEVLNIYGFKRDAGGSPPRSRRAGSMDILSLWTGIYKKENSKLKIHSRMFARLKSLSVDMNLNDVRQAVVLAFVLKECIMLKELGIINSTALLDPDGCEIHLPYTETEFWQRQKFFDCLEYKMKLVWIKNFSGEFLELEFAKFMIRACLVLERIAILHKSDAAEKLACLLPLKRGCPSLNIALMPQLDEEDNKQARIGRSTNF